MPTAKTTPNHSPEPALLLERAQLALYYLEHLSADSAWAHRASGLRGSLWEALQVSEDRRDPEFFLRLQARVDLAYWMLEQAAREIPDGEASA